MYLCNDHFPFKCFESFCLVKVGPSVGGTDTVKQTLSDAQDEAAQVNTLSPVYNEFGYNEHPIIMSRFLRNVKKVPLPV